MRVDPNHVHDENCYGGHKHSNYPVYIHIHAHKPGNCREYLAANTVHTRCKSCGTVNISGAFYYWNENTNRSEISYSDFSGTARCPDCRSTNVEHLYQYYYYQYSCGYNRNYIYGAPEGAGEKVPFNVEFEYERSYPQERLLSTYTSGCYTLHYSKYVTNNFSYDDTYGHIIHGSILGGINKMIYTDQFKNYCRIPLYYTVGLFDSTTYEYGDGFNSTQYYSTPNLCYLTYKAYLDDRGVLRFKLMNYRAAYTPTGLKSGTDNPGFPDNITASQLAAMKESRLNNLFLEVFNVNYSEMRSRQGDSLKAHVKCLNSSIGTEEYLDICGFDHSLGVNRWIITCGYDEDGTADCNLIIVSLVPTHPIQTVYINDPLITTAVATYKDGSSKTVVCTTDFTTSTIGKDKTVILTFNYVIDGVTHGKTCTITVSVIPRNKTCPKGHIYNVNPDGSDPGCPYCRAWIENLRVIYPVSSPIVITIGTTLIENGVKLLATYMDGHTEVVINGYIDNLDKHYLGTKPVTIGYKGASVTVLVTTVCATMICDICGYEYNLYPDGTNPGCPRCIQKIPVFTGNIMEYERINQTEEILEVLYNKGQYVFNLNDVFSINVNNKSSNIGRKFLRKVYPSLTDRWLSIERNEHIMSK